jgi:GDPmannose 4,6-dehydratase
MHTVREFTEKAFAELDIEIVWSGQGADETGRDKKTGRTLIKIDPRYFRPAEVEQLLGNPAKAKKQLGWEPKVKFAELVKIMVKADWEKAQKRAQKNK